MLTSSACCGVRSGSNPGSREVILKTFEPGLPGSVFWSIPLLRDGEPREAHSKIYCRVDMQVFNWIYCI